MLPPTRDPTAEENEQLEALRRLAALLGVQLIEEGGEDLAEVVARVARDRGTTYVLIGAPPARGGCGGRRAAVDGCCVALPASTCASSPTARSESGRGDDRGPLLAGIALGLAGGVLATRDSAAAEHRRSKGAERILFPFVGGALSERALEACCASRSPRTRRSIPAYLVTVPMALRLDAPLPSACDVAFELLEAIEQRAAAASVAVDGRIGPGRKLRHAMRQVMAGERFDRIVVAGRRRGLRRR